MDTFQSLSEPPSMKTNQQSAWFRVRTNRFRWPKPNTLTSRYKWQMLKEYMKPMLNGSRIRKLRRICRRKETSRRRKMFREVELTKRWRPYHQMMERILSSVEWMAIMTTRCQCKNSIAINLFSWRSITKHTTKTNLYSNLFLSRKYYIKINHNNFQRIISPTTETKVFRIQKL